MATIALHRPAVGLISVASHLRLHLNFDETVKSGVALATSRLNANPDDPDFRGTTTAIVRVPRHVERQGTAAVRRYQNGVIAGVTQYFARRSGTSLVTDQAHGKVRLTATFDGPATVTKPLKPVHDWDSPFAFLYNHAA